MDKQYKRTIYDSKQHCPTCKRNFNVGYGLKSAFEMIDIYGKQTRFYNKTCRHCGCEFRFYWDKVLKKNVFFIKKEGKMSEERYLDRLVTNLGCPWLVLEDMLDAVRRSDPHSTITIYFGKNVFDALSNRFELVQPLGQHAYYKIGEYRIDSDHIGCDSRLNPDLIRIRISYEQYGYVPYEATEHLTNRRRITTKIKKVIFNNPATIVIWADGTKTVVKRQKGDRYDKEKGLAMAFVKRTMGLKEFYKHMEEAEE